MPRKSKAAASAIPPTAFSVNQAEFSKGLALVSRALPPRPVLPITGCILMASDEGGIRLSATNLELAISCRIPAVGADDAGALAVPGKTLLDLVASLTAETLALAPGKDGLMLTAGRTTANLKCLPAAEFPAVPRVGDAALELGPAALLAEVITQVVPFAADDESRPLLTGASLSLNGCLELAACDGFRLSVRRASLAKAVDVPQVAIIPGRALAELARICAKFPDETVWLELTNGQARFRVGPVGLVAQLLEGTYPNYASIIPSSSQTRATVAAADLLALVKGADVFAREAAHALRLKLEPATEVGPGSVSLFAQSAESGDHTAQVEASVEGPALEIAFNAAYVKDSLTALGKAGPQVRLETTTAAAPGKLTVIGRDDLVHVVMPLHLGQ